MSVFGKHAVKLFVAALLLSAFALHAEDEEKTVTGNVSVQKDEGGAVTGITLKAGDASYKVVVDDNGKKLAAEDAAAQYEVKGTVSKEGETSVLKVASYKKVEAKKAE